MSATKSTTQKTSASKKVLANDATDPVAPSSANAPVDPADEKKITVRKSAASAKSSADPASAPEAPAATRSRSRSRTVVPAAVVVADESANTAAPAVPPEPAPPSAAERYRMVQDAAYFLAEKDGFNGGSTDYWIQAEREIAAQLGETAT